MPSVLKVAPPPADISETEETTIETRLSVIVPTFDTTRDAEALINGILHALEGIARPHEILLAGGPGTRDRAAAAKMAAGDRVQVRAFETSVIPDEEEALKLALSRASGDMVLTLPGWRVPEPDALRTIFADAEGHDLAIGSHLSPAQAEGSSWRRRLFHGTVQRLFGARFHDLFCRVRLGRRAVFEETAVLGVRQHFIPVVADWRGYDVTESYLASPGRKVGTHRAISLSGHFRATVDLLMLYVVLKFLHRPLRFFSAIGAPLVALGTLITSYLVIARLLGLTSLSDRPALIFGVLFIVLGVQVIAIGLIGEIVVFTSKRRAKTYDVDTVVQDSGRNDDDRRR